MTNSSKPQTSARRRPLGRHAERVLDQAPQVGVTQTRLDAAINGLRAPNPNVDAHHFSCPVLTHAPTIARLRAVANARAGVYIWLSPDGHAYVGSSSNLWRRLQTYNQARGPVIRDVGRRVVDYFRAHGHAHLNLTVLVLTALRSGARVSAQVQPYEQLLIDDLQPSLNTATTVIRVHRLVPGYAPGVRVHASCKPVAACDGCGTVLYIYESRAHACAGLNMHHHSLRASLNTGRLYRGALAFRDLSPRDVLRQPRYNDHDAFLAYVNSVRFGPAQWSARAQPLTVRLIQPDGSVGEQRDYPSVRAASRDLLPHLPWTYLRDYVRGRMRRPYRKRYVVTLHRPPGVDDPR